MRLLKALGWFAFLSLALMGPSNAQVAGIALCTGNPPTAISASTVSSNTLLSTCGPVVVLMNIGSVEAFFDIGATSAAAATTSSKSLPANSFVVINVPISGYYVAAITASSTTTIRLLQGFASP